MTKEEHFRNSVVKLNNLRRIPGKSQLEWNKQIRLARSICEYLKLDSTGGWRELRVRLIVNGVIPVE